MALQTHIGQTHREIVRSGIDETGSLLLRWGGGLGVLNDRDLALATGLFTDLHGKPVDDALLTGAFDPHLAVTGTGVYVDYTDTVYLSAHPIRRSRTEIRFDPVPCRARGGGLLAQQRLARGQDQP